MLYIDSMQNSVFLCLNNSGKFQNIRVPLHYGCLSKVGSIKIRLIALELEHVGLDYLMFQMVLQLFNILWPENVTTNLSRHAVAYRNSFQEW